MKPTNSSTFFLAYYACPSVHLDLVDLSCFLGRSWSFCPCISQSVKIFDLMLNPHPVSHPDFDSFTVMQRLEFGLPIRDGSGAHNLHVQASYCRRAYVCTYVPCEKRPHEQ